MMMVGGLAVVLYFAGLCQRGVATLAVPTSIALHDASARSTADGALLGGGGFVSGWLQAITAGSEVPVAVQLCSLQPPMKPQPRPPTNCDIGGKWTYCDAPYVYIFVPSSPGNQRGPFTVNSNKTSDPWHEANGEYLSPNSTAISSPARCAGGLVPHRAGSGSWDIDIHFNCVKGSQPHIESHKGRFSPDCNSLTMDDGGSYKRVGTHPTMGADTDTDSNTEAGWQREDSGCSVAQLIPVRHDDARDDMWVPAAQPGWTQTVKQYMLADRSLQFDVAISTDNAKSVVRVQSNVTALKHLTRCVGGVALLNLTIQHTASTPTTLYGSTGGPAGASTALQPWQCPLGSRGKNMTCQHVAGTPFRPHEDLTTTPLIATVDSGIDGRSSNFQLAIHSVAMGSVAAAQHGVWMAPEYSGLWRQDTWQLADATRFYWYLPSLLTSMNEGQTIELPAAAFGEWSANGGASDWSNAVRKVISQHFTPLANRVTKQRPWAKATYQGLGALPSYQTEDVLYQTVANAQLLELEQWTWDAGTYTWCKPSSQCNGTAVVEGRCCDSQGDWFAQQGDYMPQDTRFPEHGFMALQRSVGQAVGSTGGRANMGVWITPQASFNDKRTFQNNKRLYLAGGGPGAPPSTNNLLNLSDPRAQDLFFHQFQTLILQYNCSRIWFDYNTASRQTHWNLWEAEDAQGLLELGFYRGLYNVFDRTLATFPTVWIEGCASGGRMIDLGSLSRTMSHWSNDDSISDDRNRRFRLGANHFLPAHYIQNAFLPVGCGHLPPDVLEPVTGAISIDPQRLLTYFNGVLQFGQGLGFWSNASLLWAKHMVSVYKSIRHFLDPLCCNYYRLFEAPTTAQPTPTSPPNPPSDLTALNVGWIYEDAAKRQGIIFLMAQQTSSSTEVKVALSHSAGWPTTVPAPGIVRNAAAAKPVFKLLAGAAGTQVRILGNTTTSDLVVQFPCTNSQALLSYMY